MTPEEKKACQKLADQRYKERHPEKLKEKDRKRYQENREKEAERNSKYHRDNKKSINVRARNNRHKIKQGWFDRKRLEQNNCCALCLNHLVKTPHIDHDHRCCPPLKSCDKCRRGLLCADCNLGLGRFKDDIFVLQRAVQYLDRYGKEFMKLPLQNLKDPYKEHHDLKTTRATIKELLANGTPDWVAHPDHYKNFVKESFQAAKEESDAQVSDYRMPHTDILTNAKARRVNIIPTREFIRKLRASGVKCFTVDNGMPGTVALWAVNKFTGKLIYVCYLQIPFMQEWSLLRLDRHGLPAGEDYRGWRTVLIQLITKKIITEKKAHEVFGKPTDSEVSLLYRESLFYVRNNRSYSEPANYEL